GLLLSASHQLVEQSHRCLPVWKRQPEYPAPAAILQRHKKISPGESEDLPELIAGSDDSEELPDPTGRTYSGASRTVKRQPQASDRKCARSGNFGVIDRSPHCS